MRRGPCLVSEEQGQEEVHELDVLGVGAGPLEQRGESQKWWSVTLGMQNQSWVFCRVREMMERNPTTQQTTTSFTQTGLFMMVR